MWVSPHYIVHHRWQQQLPVKRKVFVSYKCVVNGSRLRGCDTAVTNSVVTSVSKDHSAFIYNVRQPLKSLAR